MHCVPATDGAGVNSADHRRAGRLREHRFLGPGARRGRLARPVRRRRQQQLHRRRGRRRAAAGVDAARSRATWPPQVALGSRQLPGRQRADRGRVLADGVGDRQPRPANAGAPGWCRAAASPARLFDGFDNLYIGQPGAMLSFPPTQWIRWRQPVIGMPTTPRILGAGPAAGRDPSRVRCWCSTPTTASSSARRWTWSPASIRPTPRADWPTASRRGRGCPVAAAPAFSSATGIVVVSLWEPDAAAPGPGRASLPPRPDPAAHPRVDQRRRRPGADRQPGAVRRRRRPCTSTAATSTCGRSTPPTASRNGQCRWTIWRRRRRRCRRTA